MGLPNDIHSTTMGASIETVMMGKETSNQLALNNVPPVGSLPMKMLQNYNLYRRFWKRGASADHRSSEKRETSCESAYKIDRSGNITSPRRRPPSATTHNLTNKDKI
eukprot:scaffold1129_cov210-Alexandrium_tamarense.AAC.5